MIKIVFIVVILDADELMANNIKTKRRQDWQGFKKPWIDWQKKLINEKTIIIIIMNINYNIVIIIIIMLL